MRVKGVELSAAGSVASKTTVMILKPFWFVVPAKQSIWKLVEPVFKPSTPVLEVEKPLSIWLVLVKVIFASLPVSKGISVFLVIWRISGKSWIRW